MSRKDEVKLYAIENGIYDQVDEIIAALENIQDILTKEAIDRTFLNREATYGAGDILDIGVSIMEVKVRVLGIEKSMTAVAKVD